MWEFLCCHDILQSKYILKMTQKFANLMKYLVIYWIWIDCTISIWKFWFMWFHKKCLDKFCGQMSTNNQCFFLRNFFTLWQPKKFNVKGKGFFFGKKGQTYHILKRKNVNSTHLESTFLEVAKTKRDFVNFLFSAFISNHIWLIPFVMIVSLLPYLKWKKNSLVVTLHIY